MKIKKILISQPTPKVQNSPYINLAKRYNLQIDFRPFIEVEGIEAEEFRKQRIDILDHQNVVFTSRTSIRHFFRICENLRITVPESMKYFCCSEAVALYLQKYITYRKRKVFFEKKNENSLVDLIKAKKTPGKILLPISDNNQHKIARQLQRAKLKFTKAPVYRTIQSNLSDIPEKNYDIFVFYSPHGIKSFLENFPEFEQNDVHIASFGDSTAKAAKDAGLKPTIKAPTAKAPSMVMALEQYIKKHNN